MKANEIQPGIYVGKGKRREVCKLISSVRADGLFGQTIYTKNKTSMPSSYFKMSPVAFRRWKEKTKARRVF